MTVTQFMDWHTVGAGEEGVITSNYHTGEATGLVIGSVEVT